MTTHPEVLILGSRFDFSCDYVVSCLGRRNVSYLRLNSEDISRYAVTLNPVSRELTCSFDGDTYLFSADSLKSIWFRRAIYLRDYGVGVPSDIAGQIARAQWAAFMRSLMVFSRAKWVNHPHATYLAEQKAVQLATASDLGFAVPATVFTNDIEACTGLCSRRMVMKGIDTVIAYEDEREYFAFVEPFDPRRNESSDLRAIPVTIQQAVEPKIDLRVTVVGDRVFAAEIKAAQVGISGDWRKDKQNLTYSKCHLPRSLERQCIELTAKLGLCFGGIDLARDADAYVFFEINPTGEWSWLVDSAGLPIDEAIADALSN